MRMAAALRGLPTKQFRAPIAARVPALANQLLLADLMAASPLPQAFLFPALR